MTEQAAKPRVRVHTDQQAAQTSTPTQSFVNASTNTGEAIDTRGRRISIKKLSVTDRMRLFKALGPVNVKNESYFGYAALAAMVTSIDGSAEGTLANEIQIEAMVARLDDDGFDAIVSKVKELNWVNEDSGNPDTIKN